MVTPLRDDEEEDPVDKILRKCTEQPLVPIGMIATASFLGVGLYSFQAGQKRLSQRMMRFRILGQAFTILAAIVGPIVGMGYYQQTQPKKAKKPREYQVLPSGSYVDPLPESPAAAAAIAVDGPLEGPKMPAHMLEDMDRAIERATAAHGNDDDGDDES